jgi:predicted PurR-regulated permease PerM
VVGFVGVLLWTMVRMIAALQQVLAPFLVAAILALLCKPYYDWLHRRLRHHSFALIAFYLSVLIPLGLAVWFFGGLLIGQINGLLERLPRMLHGIEELLARRLPELRPVLERLGVWHGLEQVLTAPGGWASSDWLSRVGDRALLAGAGLLLRVIGLLGWVVMPVYLAFFLSGKPPEAAAIERFLPFLKPATRADIVALAVEFQNILVAFFRGQVLVALIQALLFGLGFWLIGIEFGFVIGFILGLMNIVPYLGNAIGLMVLLPLAFLGGGMTQLLLALAVFAAVQTLDGWVITPRIMGQRTGMHPVTIIFSLFFWSVVLGGFLGLLLGIPLSAFVTVLGRLLRDKYVRELV